MEHLRFKPEHIQRLCRRQSMPSKHCKGTFDQARVSAGRTHVRETYEKCLVLYLVLKLMSRRLLVAACT
jgi:hypothetical protein